MINKYYMGLDLGAKTSPTSIAVIENNDKYKIVCVYSVQPLVYYNAKVTRKLIAFAVSVICNQHDDLFITLEEAFLKGVANKSFTKIIGAIENEIDVDLFVAPTSVKKQVAGSGKAEKDELANSLLGYNFDQKSKNLIKRLIKEELWDETDAIAIALCGIFNKQKEGE